MEEKIVTVLNEMSEYLSIAQMKKLQEVIIDIVNIGLHFILKNVRTYAAPCSEA